MLEIKFNNEIDINDFTKFEIGVAENFNHLTNVQKEFFDDGYFPVSMVALDIDFQSMGDFIRI